MIQLQQVQEIAPVNNKFYDELRLKAPFKIGNPTLYRALHYTNNSSVHEAEMWLIDHINDPEITEYPKVEVTSSRFFCELCESLNRGFCLYKERSRLKAHVSAPWPPALLLSMRRIAGPTCMFNHVNPGLIRGSSVVASFWCHETRTILIFWLGLILLILLVLS